MIKVSCRYLALSELPSTFDMTAYQEFVRPIDYDFGLARGADYLVIGIVERKRTIWFYVVPHNGDAELDFVPAVLFAFDKAKIPEGMIVRMVNDQQPSLEILPESLASIEGWFERYVDEDEEIVKIIESEIKCHSR